MARARIDPRVFVEPVTGGRLVKSYEDPVHDRTVALVEVSIDHHDMVHANAEPEALVRKLQGQLDNATRALRYALRPRPRLGAGTLGYARRKHG